MTGEYRGTTGFVGSPWFADEVTAAAARKWGLLRISYQFCPEAEADEADGWRQAGIAVEHELPFGPSPQDTESVMFTLCGGDERTIGESFHHFQQAGFDMRLWRPVLQVGGAPLGDQAREARTVGAHGIGVFPAEQVPRRDWANIGAAYGVY